MWASSRRARAQARPAAARPTTPAQNGAPQAPAASSGTARASGEPADGASNGTARAGGEPADGASNGTVRASGGAGGGAVRARGRPAWANGLPGARASRSAVAGRGPLRHWLLALNLGCAAFIGGALLAPFLAVLGWQSAADAVYATYRFACHEWAFRSFFLFGEQPIYTQQQLLSVGVDPFSFAGSPSLGWKMAFCERDLAIYVGLLLVGLLYARRRDLRPAGFLIYGVLILPMGLDGFTQLFGWRESTWELRVSTGLVFGLASAWLVLPRLDASFGLRPVASSDYAPGAVCEPLSPPPPRG